MKRFSLLFMLCPALAIAQPADQLQNAVAQEVSECGIGRIQLRVRVAQLEAELAKMKAAPALADEKKP